MLVTEVQSCSTPSWFKTFEQITVESKFIKLGQSVLQYLNSDDGIFLPSSSAETCPNCIKNQECCELHAFDSAINASIAALGGNVMPKLNWSSPKDAVWISMNHSLQCSSSDDVLLLIKSSDFTLHDLNETFNYCEDAGATDCSNFDYYLVLRKWIDIIPSSEFRCFVKERRLIGISQRHHHEYFECLTNDSSFKTLIVEFFNRSIKEKFPLENYTFDLFIDDQNDIKLLDFNPWGPITDALLFTWDELKNFSSNSLDFHSIEFRIVTNPNVQPNPYSLYGMPVDFIRMNIPDAQGSAMVADFLQMQINNQRNEEEDEAENLFEDV